MRYLLLVESLEDLLSLPKDDPRLVELPYIRTFDGDGRELAELSLKVEAESLSPELLARVRAAGFLKEALDPPLSDKRPYSPNFLGDGIRERAGEVLRMLVLELRESAPSDFLRGTSFSGRRLYSPRRRGRPLRCEDRGGLGNELGGKLSAHWPAVFSAFAAEVPGDSCILCC